MIAAQLQLDLWQQLEQAQAEPQATDWQQLCLAFDAAIARMPVSLRLATAADAIAQMAQVLEARASAWAQDWSRRPGDGPVLDLSEFVRQSLALDLSDLVAVPVLYGRTLGAELSPSDKEHGDGESVVEELSKAELLDWLEPESRLEPLPMPELEHDEDVGAWAAIVRGWMRDQSMAEVEFLELLEGVGLSIVQVWLALLLGEFVLRQSGGFYEAEGVAISLCDGAWP